ncbi:hypothetical protein ZIOFF_061957 [Zingiber officinale]|uniref:Translocon-associated protein subunit alpha n=1 Tax=Zingiber officinale TaxID=94328 RepID=A0A8J5KEZ7_ZINOF|nr:hypothetical protein ZIOFF_061957 [Zingiber officinale]
MTVLESAIAAPHSLSMTCLSSEPRSRQTEPHLRSSCLEGADDRTHRVKKGTHGYLYAGSDRTLTAHSISVNYYFFRAVAVRFFDLLSAMVIRVCAVLLALLLVGAPLLQVRCQSDEDFAATEVIEGSDIGIVGDDTHVFSDVGPAPGVDTVCVFPKNAGKLVPAGEEAELLVGLHNDVESPLNVVAIHASLHLPFDHRMLVQNLTVQEFYNASVPVSAQATFPYLFAVSKYLQPGSFDLVARIDYEIDQQPYQNVFYNGTIEVVEAGGFLTIESVFLVTLGVALLVFLGLWAYGQIQQFSKVHHHLTKPKRSTKVEVGTKATEADMDEWLKGTAYAQSLSSKSKKKK